MPLKTRAFLCLILCLSLARLARADDAPVSAADVLVREEYRRNLETFSDEPNVLVLPGLVADRRTQRAVVRAVTTSVTASDPIEFFVIGPKSGHGYEALTRSLATPSHIRRALEFIGITPGHPVDPRGLRFWPKGERVEISLGAELPRGPFGPIRMEDLVLNRREGAPLKRTGLVFTGSYALNRHGEDGEQLWASDIYGPNSIASIYNEPTTLLDLPRQAAQGDVYSFQFPNPEYALPSNTLVSLILTPSQPAGPPRVREFRLAVRAAADVGTGTLAALCFDLSAADTDAPAADEGLNNVLSAFTAIVENQQDPFVSVVFGDRVPLRLVRESCLILASIDTESGIHIEPPTAGQLYYKAFAPPTAMRSREKRPSQPLELHLTTTNGEVRAVLLEIEQFWTDDEALPELRYTTHAPATPAVLVETVGRLRPDVPVLLVFADMEITHGQLMAFVGPLLPVLPTVHVYAGGPEDMPAPSVPVRSGQTSGQAP